MRESLYKIHLYNKSVFNKTNTIPGTSTDTTNAVQQNSTNKERKHFF